MVCKKCNTEYSDAAKVCPHCGKVNDVAADAAHQTQYAYSTETSYQQPQQLQQQPKQPEQPAAMNNTYAQPTQPVQPAPPVSAPVALQPNPFDGSSILLNIICFFEPFIGLILYLSWYKEYPKRAKGVGIAALVRVILVVALGLIAGILALIFAPFVAEIIEELIYGVEDALYYMF